MKKTLFSFLMLFASIVLLHAQPTAGPTDPPARNATDVISIFSGAYTNVVGTDFDPNWGQSTDATIIDISGNSVLKYANLNYQGTQFGSNQDVSAMEFLHVDLYSDDATAVAIYCISPGKETQYDFAITQDTWVGYDIPLSTFSSVVDMTNVFQYKVTGTGGSTIYLDNLYFWKNPPAAGTDATLSDLKVSGTTVTGFSANTLSYTIDLVEGTTVVPTVTATTTDASASANITPAASLPGTTTVLVTAQDGTTQKTYSVNFKISIPAAGAPAPPARNAADVISVFSGAYTDLSGTDFDPWWGQSTDATIIDLSGNSTLKYANLNYQGTQFTNSDVSAMEYLHVDLWDADAAAVSIYCISPGKETNYDFAITQGQWESYDIPLSTFSSVVDMTNVFQFKVTGTGGSTIYLDNLYFWKTAAAAGTDATLSDLKVDGTTISNFSANTLVYTYGLVNGTTVAPTVTATTTDVNADVTITPAASIPDTTYVHVTAQDGTTTKTYKIAFRIAIPAVAAPTPTNDAADVISIFSNAFTDVAGTDFDPNWGQSTDATIVDIAGNSTLKYATFNYQGTNFGSDVDASGMEYLHIDLWTNSATVVKVTPISHTAVTEYLVSLTPINKKAWNSYDIPLTDFTNNGMSMASLYQLKFDGTAGVNPSNIYLDNIYFYKVPYVAASDATLSDLKVDGTTITGFSSSVYTYKVNLVEGTTVVPTVTATSTDANANVSITPAPSIPDTTKVVVTAQDGVTKKTYNLVFVISVPAAAAPVPPTRETSDVVSIFSGAYTDVASTNFNPSWGQATVATTVDLSGNSTIKYTNLNYQGIEFGSHQDVSAMQYLHLDLWNADADAVSVYCISPGPLEKGYALTTQKGTWQSYDIELSEFSSVVNMADVFQFKFTGTNGSTIYLDNLYFYKDPTTAGSDATLSDLQVDGTTITGFTSTKLNYQVGLAEGTTVVPTITATSTDANANVEITAATSIPGTTTIVVTAENGTTTKTYNVSFAITIPAAAATTPPAREAADVISIFSDAYTNVSGTDYNPSWGQTTVATTVDYSGNSIYKYSNFNYQGIHFGSIQNVTEMEYLHVDLWNANATTVKVYCISSGPLEKSYTLTLTTGAWASYDIPLTYFENDIELNHLIEFKFEGTAGSTIYIDNLYFYRAAAQPSTDATLSDIKVDGSTITGFNIATYSYNIELPYGTTTVPVVTAVATDANAEVEITEATELPGTTSILVTAEDGSTTLTYTVNFTLAEPNTDATLSDLLLNDESISGFRPDSLDYSYELPFGTTTVPVISAVKTDATATMVITQAASVNDTALIEITAQDGTTTLIYSVALSVADEISNDATLKRIRVNGTAIVGFNPQNTDYSVELPYGTTDVPTVTGTTNNLAATLIITNAASLNDTTILVVTAQDSVTTMTYKVSFTIADPVYNVKFIVVDAAQNAIENAQVAFFQDTLFTTIDGIVEFMSVSPTNDVSYVVSKDGYFDASGTVSIVDADVEVNVTLALEAYNVIFTVVDRNNEPLALTEVILQNDTISTDEDGVAIFTDVVPVTYAKYKVSKEGYLSYADSVSVVDADVEIGVQLDEPKFSVTFVIADASDNALPGVEVTFMDSTITTEENGVAIYTDLYRDADIPYTIEKDGYIANSGTITITDQDVTKSITLALITYTVKFKVVDESTTAVEGATVAFNETSVETNADGIAEFSSVAPVTDAAYSVNKTDYQEATGTVSVIDANVDVDVTLIFVGINDYTESINCIYPNPAYDFVNIKVAGSNATIEIFSSEGNLIKKESISNQQGKIDIRELNAGIYFVKITDGINQHINKLVINE